MLLSVELSSSHLLCGSHTDCVGNTLSERTGGGLDTRSSVLGVRELRVTRSHGVVLTEVLKLFNWKIVSSKVEPRVDEHGSVSSREDEAVTVDPGRVLVIVRHVLAP